MDQPIDWPIAPMLAKSAAQVPVGDYGYEPKWDGFRGLVARDGDQVQLLSRSGKLLNRYFPELEEQLRSVLPRRCVLDGEIVVRTGQPGHQRLDWEALSARVHPADSRVRMLAEQTPAEYIAFDLLALGSQDVMGRAFSERRGHLESAVASAAAPLHLTRMTTDPGLARDWFERFEGAGLDGVIAKPLAGVYTPGKRSLQKVKHARTAEAVVLGYRVHKSGDGVGSLLLGLYGPDGQLRNVGGIVAFPMSRRRELVDELAPLVQRDAEGHPVRGESERSRFTASKDVSFVTLRPERVVEVAFDQLEGLRFRHAVRFVRWRPDRDPESCTLEQVERAPDYDLGDVLT